MELFWVNATLRVKQTFWNSLVSLINNFRQFYKRKNSGIICILVHSLENPTATNIFDFDFYLSFYGEQDKPFMVELTKTQVAFIKINYFRALLISLKNHSS